MFDHLAQRSNHQFKHHARTVLSQKHIYPMHSLFMCIEVLFIFSIVTRSQNYNWMQNILIKVAVLLNVLQLLAVNSRIIWCLNESPVNTLSNYNVEVLD